MIKAWLVDNGPLRGASPISVNNIDSILFISIEASDGHCHICQAEDITSLLGDPPGFALLVQNYSDLDSIEFKKVRDFTSLLKWNFSLFQSIESVYSPAAIFIIESMRSVISDPVFLPVIRI